MIRAIASNDFPPFGAFRLEFPPVPEKPDNLAEVHLFTGVNGTGKTRLLSILSAMLGNPLHLHKRVKGPKRSTLYVSEAIKNTDHVNSWPRMIASEGSVTWEHDPIAISKSLLAIPAFAYSGNAYIADAQVAAMGTFQPPNRHVCLSFNHPDTDSAILLQAIANLMLSAAIDQISDADIDQNKGRSSRLLKSLESALTEITGTRFQFKLDRYPKLSLSVKWNEAQLSFDLLPDGLRSIIGWLVHAVVMMEVWLQGKQDPTDAGSIFLLDEIESHLHPAWQRKILPAFQRLFPKAQIFIATHSPFVIASLNHGWIYPLKMGTDGKASIDAPIRASQGDSYITVVEEIMGVKEWYDPETEKMLNDFRVTRDAAYKGDISAREKATNLAHAIGQRSMELDFMMGKELNQMNRQLSKRAEGP